MTEFEFVGGEKSAGESGYGAGEHAFARIAAQRYIRAQKTRSKCRRRFTALRLRFPTHNSKFNQEKMKTELYRLIWELYSVLMFENRKTDKQLAVVEKVLSSLFWL